MRISRGLAVLLLACGAAAAEPQEGEAPRGSPEAPPRLDGVLGPEALRARVARVLLLDRSLPQEPKQNEVRLRTCPVEYDPATGRLEARNVPEGTYDLLVVLKDGTRYEGADLRAPPGEGELTDAEREAVERRAFAARSFYDERRILQMRGNGEWAVLLVELVRRGRTSLRAREPFVVWRVEVWTFHKLYGAWSKEESKVLRRFRPDVETFAEYNWVFLPELGGIELARGRAARLAIELPERLDPAFGRVSPERLKEPAPDPGEADAGGKPGEAPAAREEAKKEE